MMRAPLIAMGMALVAGGCQHTAMRQEPASSAEPIVKLTPPEPIEYPAGVVDRLHVNGDTLTVDELLAELRTAMTAAAARGPEAYQAYLAGELPRQIAARVHDMLLYQKAAVGMDTPQMTQAVSQIVDEEIRKRVTTSHGGRQSRYESALREAGSSLDEVKRQIGREVIVTKYLQEHIFPRIAHPTRHELWRYYQEHLHDYTSGGRRKLQLIDIPFRRDRAAARAAADDARRRIATGETFDDVAREVSTGINASNGGRWGVIESGMQGRYAPVWDVLITLSEDEMSPVIEGQDAWFIVKAIDVEPVQCAAFPDIQSELTERYRGAQFDYYRRQLLMGLIDEAVIEPSQEAFFEAVVASAPRPEELAGP